MIEGQPGKRRGVEIVIQLIVPGQRTFQPSGLLPGDEQAVFAGRIQCTPDVSHLVTYVNHAPLEAVTVCSDQQLGLDLAKAVEDALDAEVG